MEFLFGVPNWYSRIRGDENGIRAAMQAQIRLFLDKNLFEKNC
jgi:hypothetical protein